MDLRTLGLYVITDRRQTLNRSLESVISQALEGGARFFQLREKDLSAKELCLLGERLRALIKPHGGYLLINDRVDAALVIGADGVHLPQNGLSAGEARRLLGPGKIIGTSTHSLTEAQKAQEEGADFITFGPLFYTPSKAQYGEPVGLDSLKEVKKHLNIPVFGLGGIKTDNAVGVIAAGADGIAVISAVSAAGDVKQAVRTLIGLLHQH